MRFSCEKCQARYEIADEKAAGKILRIRCKRCQHSILLDNSGRAAGPRGTAPVKPGPPLPSAPPSQTRPPHPPVTPQEKPADAPANAERQQWFAATGGTRVGPETLEELENRVLAGESITPRSYVWREGMPQWARLRDVPELGALLELALKQERARSVREASLRVEEAQRLARLAAEEQSRLAVEDAARRAAEEEEARRVAEEEEARRIAEEDEARRAEEAAARQRKEQDDRLEQALSFADPADVLSNAFGFGGPEPEVDQESRATSGGETESASEPESEPESAPAESTARPADLQALMDEVAREVGVDESAALQSGPLDPTPLNADQEEELSFDVDFEDEEAAAGDASSAYGSGEYGSAEGPHGSGTDAVGASDDLESAAAADHSGPHRVQPRRSVAGIVVAVAFAFVAAGAVVAFVFFGEVIVDNVPLLSRFSMITPASAPQPTTPATTQTSPSPAYEKNHLSVEADRREALARRVAERKAADERAAGRAESAGAGLIPLPLLREKVAALQPAIEQCIREEAARAPERKLGRVIATAIVAPSGSVAEASFTDAAFASSELGACVSGAVKTMEFPPFTGDVATLEIPLDLGAR